MGKGQPAKTDTDIIQLTFKSDLKRKVVALCRVKDTSVSQVVRDYLWKWSDREIEKLSPEKRKKFDDLLSSDENKPE